MNPALLICVRSFTGLTDMAGVTDINKFRDQADDDKPHVTHETMCVKCLYRSMYVYPVGVPLIKLECGGCGGIGFIINTGQSMEEGE